MATYIILYLGGASPRTKEEGAAGQAKWHAWTQALGDAVVNAGTPMMNTKIVSAEGVSDATGISAMTGYTTVQADSLEAALEMAKKCPYLEMDGGTLAVAELMKM